MYENYEKLKFERRGKVLTVTMDNPPMNAADLVLHTELSHVFYDIARDDECEIVVLTGNGRAFSAGGDIKSMHKNVDDYQHHAKMYRRGSYIVHGLLALDKVVIARINGHALGFGATIALLSDLTIASNDAKIGDPHINIGVSAGDGGSFIWPQHIGFAQAKWFLLTGDHMTAPEAERIGLINKSVPAEELDEAVYELSERLANGPTMAINTTKRSINMLLKRQVEGVIEAHLGLEFLSQISQDYKGAVKSFLDKEKPTFQGK